MITSAIISKIRQYEAELRLSGSYRDPKRRAYLQARLKQLKAQCGQMGYSETEIADNNVAAPANKVEVGNRQILVPLPSWTTNTTDNDKK
jgi:hypothetical protein